jgi:hypothetical protein
MNTSSASLLRLVVIVALALSMSACEAIGTIFEAGIWVGVIMVVIVLAIVGFIAAKLRRPVKRGSRTRRLPGGAEHGHQHRAASDLAAVHTTARYATTTRSH